MKIARKIDAILKAWLDYIDLNDYSDARVEANKRDKVKRRGVSLVGDRVLIEQTVFSDLRSRLSQGNQDITWALSFPQVTDTEKKKYFCPLFCLDVTSIFRGNYQEDGWDIEELELTEAGTNLATFLKLDDEQCEKLITQDGLREFLETTFKLKFKTYEEWMQRFDINGYHFEIQRQPYLFEFNGAIYSKNLKQDLKEIESGSKNWSKGHPAYEYLFGEPRPPKHEVSYMGAFPTHPPTNSQLTAIKHSQTEPITAVHGPPGSGKTTLILHVIAQQVVKRALNLIKTGKEIDNLTVISSTNNKAVDNVIEKLDEVLENELFYLKGGSKNNINSAGGASQKLQNAINYLDENKFDTSHHNYVLGEIKRIKEYLESQENHYLNLHTQLELYEVRKSTLHKKIESLQLVNKKSSNSRNQPENSVKEINAEVIELKALKKKLESQSKDFYTYFHSDYHEEHKKLFELSREFLIQQALSKKDRVKASLQLYESSISGNWKDRRKVKENLTKHIQNVSLIFPVITTTLLSIRNMLPWVEECVDRAIVDEAGMIDQHKTFPLLVRSRKAIIVGDPQQIEPVINLSDQRRENYRQTAFFEKGLTENDYRRYSPEEEYSATTYHRAAGASGENGDKGKGIQLKEHYRCQASIIEYCDRIAGYGLEVKTKQTSSLLDRHLIAYHVEGNIIYNVNREEVNAVCELVQHLLNQGYSIEDIGVISAFRPQANALEKSLRQKFSTFDKNSVGTVHTFQGAEKKIIIFSSRVSRPQDESKVSWINKQPNLLNVAVSRAQELFILVGNLDRLEKGGIYTRQLVEHIRQQGIILEYKSAAEIPQAKPGADFVYDCDHLSLFRDAIAQAEQELIIVTPKIQGNEPKKFVNDIVSALEKGVKVTVIYGNKSGEEHDHNDPQTEKKLKDLFSQYSGSNLIRLGREIHIESRGTNERILLCDDKFAVIGSWNWLSHHYRESCRRLLIKPNVQIRRETSIQLSDSSSITDIKTRVNKLIT